jgi:hypothetical protein
LAANSVCYRTWHATEGGNSREAWPKIAPADPHPATDAKAATDATDPPDATGRGAQGVFNQGLRYRSSGAAQKAVVSVICDRAHAMIPMHKYAAFTALAIALNITAAAAQTAPSCETFLTRLRNAGAFTTIAAEPAV